MAATIQNFALSAALVLGRTHFVRANAHEPLVEASIFPDSADASVWIDALGSGLAFGAPE